MATIFAGYELEGIIGKGGMAEVFRARPLTGARTGQVVALKRLLPSLVQDSDCLERFVREGDLTRGLEHPAIVRVFETGVEAGAPFIAMEYVDGKNLRQILAQCAQRAILLPIDFAAYVVHTIAQALDHAHQALSASGEPLQIVHCDVSPSNVFISRLGEVKLGDFGVARTTAAPGHVGQAAYGKVRYLAPEQIRGELVTLRVDLFALGAVLFELLTNEPAFPGADANEVGQRILRGETRAPSSLRPGLPAAFDTLVLAALQHDPHRRPPSAAAFAKVLAARYDPAIGTPLAIASVVRGLFGLGSTG